MSQVLSTAYAYGNGLVRDLRPFQQLTSLTYVDLGEIGLLTVAS